MLYNLKQSETVLILLIVVFKDSKMFSVMNIYEKFNDCWLPICCQIMLVVIYGTFLFYMFFNSKSLRYHLFKGISQFNIFILKYLLCC